MGTAVIRTDALGKQYDRGRRASSGLLRDSLARTFSFLPPSSRRAPDKFWALRNICIEIKQGEVIGLVGRNGSGKTTLLKILSRITRPTEGTAEIHGRVGTLLEVGTGFHPELTGRENTFFSASILGMKRQEIVGKFDEIVAFAELEKFIDTPVKHYSSGMYVRLAFAVAAHLDPEILFVDEVLAVGDVRFQRKCLGKMGEVAQAGRTVVLVSHQLSQIRRLCRRAIWLDSGEVRRTGAAPEIVTAYEAAMTDTGLDEQRPVHGRAQFLGWRLEDPVSGADHSLATDGQISIVFTLRANDDLRSVHLGVLLYDQDRRPLWSRTMEGFSVERGVHEVRYTLASLPLQPGIYYWRIGLYDSGERIDDWECLPQMQVITVPLTQTRDDVAGVLNVSSEWSVRAMKDTPSAHQVTSAD